VTSSKSHCLSSAVGGVFRTSRGDAGASGAGASYEKQPSRNTCNRSRYWGYPPHTPSTHATNLIVHECADSQHHESTELEPGERLPPERQGKCPNKSWAQGVQHNSVRRAQMLRDGHAAPRQAVEQRHTQASATRSRTALPGIHEGHERGHQKNIGSHSERQAPVVGNHEAGVDEIRGSSCRL